MFKDTVNIILEKMRIKRDQSLFRQWAEHYDLPPRESRVDQPKFRKGNLYQQWVDEGSLTPQDIPQENTSVTDIPTIARDADPQMARRLLRYIIMEGIAIIVLLIALAVVITLLIVK